MADLHALHTDLLASLAELDAVTSQPRCDVERFTQARYRASRVSGERRRLVDDLCREPARTAPPATASALDALRQANLEARVLSTKHIGLWTLKEAIANWSGYCVASARMRATMRYTDASIGRFLDSIRGEPWFRNTIIIVLADHGFPLSEHGSSTIGYGLYAESMWIPFVIAGTHPRLGPGAWHDYPACQLDIGPTVLDLAGIRAANHFLGHSLVRPATGLHSSSYLVRGEQGTLERGDFRIHGPLGERPREQGPEVFNTVGDRTEKRNLYPQDPAAKAAYDSLLPLLQTIGKLNTYAVEANLLWPDSAAARK